LKKTIKEYLKIEPQKYYGQSFKILITGGKRKGKSTLAVDLAKNLSITNVTYSSNFDLLGKLDHQKALFLKELFQDSTISHESVMIIDDIDQMIELAHQNNHLLYSNTSLQTFKTLFSTPVPNKVIFIATASSLDGIKQIELVSPFHHIIEI
jgi:SpoVK/Ycf46/Vps4 family AAA+-type ATPase